MAPQFLKEYTNAGLKTETLTWAAYGMKDSKDKNNLCINFLKLDELIIIPSFNQKEDEKAALKLQNLYNRKVIQINAEKLAEEGGVINCVTWNL